jgi:hypothetical protein
MNSTTITRDNVSEAVTLISGTTVSGAFYAFVLILYCLAARLSYSQLRNVDGKIKRPTAFTLALASLMMCATIDVTLSNIQIRITYVDYGSLPGGTLGLAAGLHATTVTRVRLLIRFAVNNLLISRSLVSFLCVST